ncbi:uncharacterized protein (TIGR02246 family) [Actinopolyspora biskrensis]|uniref:Uncharacterized protein (TIGR02246 family) n=1 Tax=Actinopolyspora biskrensis TaxID=1470178 RepID=A0A852Z0P8_9ACTN|nr:SgcJ/EcaC family oxidoreductase [Actinopolyspora biskrensis]NYH80391.1 uncharacterized protein (TIGR02246 family) [Actinopolyspora biskrensis]
MRDRPKAHDAVGDEDDARAIRRIFTELREAFAEHDAEKFDERFASDVVFTAVNGQRFHGWEEIHRYHRERLTHHAEGIRTWYEIDRITFPDPSVAVVFLRQPVVTRDDQRASIGTWVLVKKEGSWWFCAMHNTGIASGVTP